MAVDVRVPELGESVVEATVGTWFKKEGDFVAVGDTLVELQTDKVDLEVSADQAGILKGIQYAEGADVEVGQVLAVIEPAENGAAAEDASSSAPAKADSPQTDSSQTDSSQTDSPQTDSSQTNPTAAEKTAAAAPSAPAATPVARRMAAAEGVDLDSVSGSGKQGRVTKQDVTAHVASQAPGTEAAARAPAPEPAQQQAERPAPAPEADPRGEARVKMSRRRRTIARRLVEAQHAAAILTTFNEVDMSAVMALRARRKDAFKAEHGVSLGISSFFVKASVGALKAFPRLNAEIQGDEMVLKSYFDIGMAIGAEEGLVVPVLRDADRLSFADIGRQISAFADKARTGKLTLEDLRGGTFTITNGGVYGSMLSTPILNPPQVGILGLHNIVDRPVAIDGAIEVRPVMYIALSYDHRIVDGREAVQFLVKIKTLVEDPEALLLEG